MSIWDKPISHGELLKKAWKHLDLGVIERKHPFHSPVFATIDGDFASPRTVILRRFWRHPARIAFHAHIGSPKIDQLRVNPNAAWHFYHPEEKLQLRIRGITEIHAEDDLADEQWAATRLFAKRCYVGATPSQVSKKPTHGLPEELRTREPNPEENDIARKQFCVIATKINYLEMLELDVRGHRRSFFRWNENGEMENGWLTP